MALVAAAVFTASLAVAGNLSAHQDEIGTPAATPAGADAAAFDYTRRAQHRTTFQAWPQVDEVPSAAPAVALEESTWQANPWPVRTHFAPTAWAEDDFPAPAAILGEDADAYLLANVVARTVVPVFDAADDIVPAGAVQTPFEDDAQALPPPPPRPSWVAQEWTEPDFAPPPFVAPDDGWNPPAALTAAPIATLWSDPDEWPTAAAFVPSDDDAQPPALRIPQATSVVWATDEEIVPQPAAALGGGPITYERGAPRFVRWYQHDELPAQAAATAIEDDHWSPPCVVAAPPAQPLWWHQDEIATEAPAAIASEDEAPPPAALPTAPVLQLWLHQDEIATPALPLGIEDEYWQAPTVLKPEAHVLPWQDGEALVEHACTLSAQHHAWLELLARAHGLIDPLQVSATARSDGTLVQTVSEAAGTVTVTTTAAPSGAAGGSALTGQQAAWLEALVRLHAGIDPLSVSETERGDGTVQQTLAVALGVTTVTRTS